MVARTAAADFALAVVVVVVVAVAVAAAAVPETVNEGEEAETTDKGAVEEERVLSRTFLESMDFRSKCDPRGLEWLSIPVGGPGAVAAVVSAS